MKSKEIIAILNQRSTNPGSRFEEILRSIFPQVVKNEGKTIQYNYKWANRIQFDFHFQNGIGQWNRNTVAEAKFFKEKKVALINKFLDHKFLQHRNVAVHTGPSKISVLYFILILPFNLNQKEKTSVLNHFKYLTNRFEIVFWGLDELEEYFQKYAEYITKLIPELTDQALKNIVEKSIEKGQEKTEVRPEEHLKRLVKAYKKDDLVLFLGAGVSITAGLPSWDALLSQLLLAIIEKNSQGIPALNETQKKLLADALKEQNNSSPIQAARYINSGLSDEFEKEVSEILYRNLKDNGNSDLIHSISRLCSAPRGGYGVKAITNYNFDDLIEEALTAESVKCVPIFNDNSFPEKAELGIYHVHGFLPRNPEQYEGIKESLLVFSEKNYHTIMQEPYNWSNLTQLNFFRENTCLFIGQSGTDPNLRRLLEIAKKRTQISKHYIILKRTQKEPFVSKMGKDKPDDRTISAIVEIHQKLQEVSFDEIGLNVIWVDEYEEINELLLKIKG